MEGEYGLRDKVEQRPVAEKGRGYGPGTNWTFGPGVAVPAGALSSGGGLNPLRASPAKLGQARVLHPEHEVTGRVLQTQVYQGERAVPFDEFN